MQSDLIIDLDITNKQDICEKCLLNYYSNECYNECYKSYSGEVSCIYSDNKEEYNDTILKTLFVKGGFTLYKKYSNIWNIIKTNNKGKVRLFNDIDSVTLPSISTWKVKIISYDSCDA